MVAQLPLSDARPFAPDRAGRLAVPDWPIPRYFNNPQFVQHFGGAARRRGSVDAAWADEYAYCRAHRAIALPELHRQTFGLPGAAISTVCAFRRLLVDQSTVVARIEIGLAHHPDTPLPADADERKLLAIAQSALDLPVRVPDNATTSTTGPLAGQGPRLAALYAFASTTRRRRPDVRQLRLVGDGVPMLVVEFQDHEPFATPKQAKIVDPGKVGGARAVFMWVKSKAGQVPVWFLARGNASEAHVRSLRLCILRLHAEQQALDLVLRQVQRESIRFVPEGDPDALSDYLNAATRSISKAEWGGISQSAILDAFSAAESVDYGDESRELRARLAGVHRQVANKVEAYWHERTAARTAPVFNIGEGGILNQMNEQIIQSGTFHGTAVGKVNADQINSSFNTVSNSAADPDMKQALENLHNEVKALLRDIGTLTGEQPVSTDARASEPTPSAAATTPEPESVPAPITAGNTIDAEEVMRALENLTKEALASKPGKRMLEAAAETLVDAGKLVAKHAAPIVAAVSAVLKLAGIPIPF